jgi:hypothetical protein
MVLQADNWKIVINATIADNIFMANSSLLKNKNALTLLI